MLDLDTNHAQWCDGFHHLNPKADLSHANTQTGAQARRRAAMGDKSAGRYARISFVDAHGRELEKHYVSKTCRMCTCESTGILGSDRCGTNDIDRVDWVSQSRASGSRHSNHTYTTGPLLQRAAQQAAPARRRGVGGRHLGREVRHQGTASRQLGLGGFGRRVWFAVSISGPLDARPL